MTLIDAGRVGPKKLPALFGWALFVEPQIAGRLGKLALSELRDLERSKRNVVSFDSIQLNALKVLLGRYRDSVPRVLKVDGPRSPICFSPMVLANQLEVSYWQRLGEYYFIRKSLCRGLLGAL